MKRAWKLTHLDNFSLWMIIKGAWLYDTAPDFDKMKSSLQELIKTYPIMDGYYDKAKGAMIYDDEAPVGKANFVRIERKDLKAADVIGKNRMVYTLIPPIDVKAFKNGKAKPFKAALVILSDSALLLIQCAHAVMDAHTYYNFIHQWIALYNGETITPMTIDQGLLPRKDAMSKEDAIASAKAYNWPKIQGKSLVRLFCSFILGKYAKGTVIYEVSQKEIQERRAATGAGTNAILCAITAHKFFERMPKKTQYAVNLTTDVRGRFPGLDDNFWGNCSNAFAVNGTFNAQDDINANAVLIDKAVKESITPEKIEKDLRLTFCASYYKLPYFCVDPVSFMSTKPDAICVNNVLKFRVCELDWGTGLPRYAYPNDLMDMIKFWQPVAGGPVQIIFGSLAGKLMK